MTMQVQYQLNLLFGHDLFDLGFNVYNFRMFRFFFTFPITIQVKSHCVTSVIAQKNTVNINHGNDVNVKSPQKKIDFS